jgi:hypothetical protein
MIVLAKKRPSIQSSYDIQYACLYTACCLLINIGWSRSLPHLPFGCTYHSWYPTNWIRQTLAWRQQPLIWPLHSSTYSEASIKRLASLHACPALANWLQPDPYPNTFGHSALIRPAAYLYEPDAVDDHTHPHPSWLTHSDDAPLSHTGIFHS